MFRRSNQLSFARTALLTALAGFALAGSAFSQDDAPVESSACKDEIVDPAIADDASSDTESEEARPERRRKAVELENRKENLRKSALAGLLVISLICIVFLILIILVALWARRIRMLTRQPLPEMHPGDPLWYLRKGKGSDSPDIAELTDGGSSHEES
jgi:hypothetical protein